MTVLQCDLGDGARMPYLEIGGPAEPPLLVLRGLGDALATVENSAEKVRAQYAPLGRRVLVPSWRIPARPGYRLADMTRDALAFVRALDLAPAAIWGNSMGGMVALLLAAQAPEAVRGIVAECTPIAATTPLTTYVDRWDRMAARRQWSRLSGTRCGGSSPAGCPGRSGCSCRSPGSSRCPTTRTGGWCCPARCASTTCGRTPRT